MGAWFWGQCVLIVCKEEKKLFVITMISALVNIVLNFVLIPLWKENAAAITTIIAEGISFIWSGIVGRKIVKYEGLITHYIKVILGCIIIALAGFTIHEMNMSYLLNMVMFIPCSMVLFFLVEMLLGNDSITDIVNTVKKKVLSNHTK